MINLLPTKEKEVFLTEQKKKVMLTLWFLVLFFLICLALILFLVKIYLKDKIEAQKTFLIRSEEEFFNSEAQEIQDKINLGNSVFIKLESFYEEKVYFSKLLEEISKKMPNLFYLTNISFVFSEEEKGKEEEGKWIEKKVTISISGFAPLREDLLMFKKNLENEENFRDIYFPPSNWVEPSDINFSVIFNIFPGL